MGTFLMLLPSFVKCLSHSCIFLAFCHFVKHKQRGENSVPVRFHNATIQHHFIQNDVHSVQIEHDLETFQVKCILNNVRIIQKKSQAPKSSIKNYKNRYFLIYSSLFAIILIKLGKQFDWHFFPNYRAVKSREAEAPALSCPGIQLQDIVAKAR